MTLQEIREQARTEYGLVGSADDGVFSNTVMNGLINRAHRWLAREARCYYTTKAADVAVGSDGLSVVALAGDVFEVDTRPGMVRARVGSGWRSLRRLCEEQLRAAGALESRSNASPYGFFLRVGALDGAHREMCLYPGGDAAAAAGLRYAAWVYPPALAEDTDAPELPEGEHDLLLPVVKWLMADMERTSGRADAPVETNFALAREAAVEMRVTAERFRRGGPRRVAAGR